MLELLFAATGHEPPNIFLIHLMAFAALTADSFAGRAAWPAALGTVSYLAAVYAMTGERSPALLVVVIPGYLAGTVHRMRRETAQALVDRGAELERERLLLAEVLRAP